MFLSQVEHSRQEGGLFQSSSVGSQSHVTVPSPVYCWTSALWAYYRCSCQFSLAMSTRAH